MIYAFTLHSGSVSLCLLRRLVGSRFCPVISMSLANDTSDNCEWPFSPPPSLENEQEKYSPNILEKIAKIIQLMKVQFNQVSKVQQSIKQQLNLAIDLKGQIQQSLISAESALQQMRTESMTEKLIEQNIAGTSISENFSARQENGDNLEIGVQIMEPTIDENAEYAETKSEVSSIVKVKKPKKVKKFKSIFNWHMFKRRNRLQPKLSVCQEETVDPVNNYKESKDEESKDSHDTSAKLDNDGPAPNKVINVEYKNETKDEFMEGEEFAKEIVSKKDATADETVKAASVTGREVLENSGEIFNTSARDFNDENFPSADIITQYECKVNECEILDLDETVYERSTKLDGDETVEIDSVGKVVVSNEDVEPLTESGVSESLKRFCSAVSLSESESVPTRGIDFETFESLYESLVLQSVNGNSVGYQQRPTSELESADCFSSVLQSFDINARNVEDTENAVSKSMVLKFSCYPIGPADISSLSPSAVKQSTPIPVEIFDKEKCVNNLVYNLELQSNVESSVVSLKSQQEPCLEKEDDVFELKTKF